MNQEYINIIYWTDCFGTQDFVAATYDVDKWLEQNNKARVADGNEPESLTEFQIEKYRIV